MKTSDLDGISTRLERLERENSRLRRFLLLGALGVASLVLVQCSGRSEALRAKSLVIEDDEGRTRATLGFEEGGTRLRLFDESGVRRASLSVAADGSPGFALFHGEEIPAAVVELAGTGVALELRDANGKSLFRRP